MTKQHKFQQISDTIRGQITEGFWKPGDRIYSERQLAEIHDVSRLTIKRALSELVSEGLLEYREGRQGTFVAEKPALDSTKGESQHFIGVAVDNHTPAFASHILQGIHEGLWEKGFHTLYCNTYQENESILDQIRSLTDNSALKGFILTPLLGPDSDEINTRIFELLESRDIPFVLVDRFQGGRDDHRVILNNREIFRSLAEYLRKEGMERILILNGFEATSSDERVRGLLELYPSGEGKNSSREIILDEKSLFQGRPIPESVIRKVKETGPYQAVIGINQQLMEAGSRILRQLDTRAVTATIVTSPRERFSDISVVQPITRMGLEAARLLIRVIEDPRLPVTQLMLKAEILDNRGD